MIRSMSYSRNFRIPNPRLTGNANEPMVAKTTTVCHQPDALPADTRAIAATTNKVAPLSSHFICRRRSPDACR